MKNLTYTDVEVLMRLKDAEADIPYKENNPKQLIPITERIKQVFRNSPGLTNDWISSRCFVDYKGQTVNSTSRSYFFAGNCNIEFVLHEKTKVQRAYVFNNSKLVIDLSKNKESISVVVLNLYDDAEVYVDAPEHVSVFIRYYSPRVQARIGPGSKCNVVTTKHFNNEEPKLINYD